MIWRPYVNSRSKRSLSRCGLLDHILCEWWLVRHYLEQVWVILGGWVWMGHYFGWVGMSGGGWENDLGVFVCVVGGRRGCNLS